MVLQVGVDKSFDEGNDDCRSVPYGTTQIDGRSAPSPLEGAPPHLATLIDEVDGLTQVQMPSVSWNMLAYIHPGCERS